MGRCGSALIFLIDLGNPAFHKVWKFTESTIGDKGLVSGPYF
jgi:hypothetical protein